MPRLTISYRRDDLPGTARAIYDRFRARYGADSVFMDIDTIELGEDYRERIYRALRETDYLLLLIGPRWVGPTAAGPNRIGSPNDPVRLEIEYALSNRLRIVPVLLENAQMPEPEDLPESLAEIRYLHAADVTSGREFDGQIDRIFRFVDRTQAELETPSRASRQPRSAVSYKHRNSFLISTIVLLLLIVIGAGTFGVVAWRAAHVASADCNEAVKLDPNGAAAHNCLGDIDARRGQFDEAVAQYARAIKLDSSNAQYFSNRGDAYFRQGEFTKAIADYNAALKIDSTLSSAIEGLKQAKAASGVPDDSP